MGVQGVGKCERNDANRRAYFTAAELAHAVAGLSIFTYLFIF